MQQAWTQKARPGWVGGWVSRDLWAEIAGQSVGCNSYSGQGPGVRGPARRDAGPQGSARRESQAPEGELHGSVGLQRPEGMGTSRASG